MVCPKKRPEKDKNSERGIFFPPRQIMREFGREGFILNKQSGPEFVCIAPLAKDLAVLKRQLTA